MSIFLDVVVVLLVADFVSGVLHWLEDSYGRPEWPVIGRLVTVPNIIHHHRPTYFTKHSWFHSAEVLIVIGIIIIVSAWSLDLLTWQVLLFVGIGVNANEVHKWNHLPRTNRPELIVGLQAARILQTAEHHARHHKGKRTAPTA